MYAHECPHCGAFLDPGERCDCRDEQREKELKLITFQKELQKHVIEGKNGQLKLAI